MEDVWDETYDAREQADVRRGAGRGAALRQDGRAGMRGGGAESGHDAVRCRDEGALSGGGDGGCEGREEEQGADGAGLKGGALVSV